MSRTVDEHVVEMRFNNSDFEKKTAQTLSTLDKLKEKLNITSDVKGLNDATKSIESLGSVKLTGLSNAVKVVDMSLGAIAKNTVFTELAQTAIHAGKTILKTLVSPIDQVINGGKKRAQNIANAKFQLEGLGIAWENISDDINYAVKSTAYGLDSAAVAASQFVASGVKLGDSMKTALRGISGVAAMTNSSYDEIANIFTTVAGQGKLMTMQMNQLAARGLNVAGTLAKAFHVSEAELREMVTKGKVSFAEFAQAMDDAYGEHAKEANKTFQGALSNVKAALSRTGANVAADAYENLRLVLVELIDVVDLFNKKMKPIIGEGGAIGKVFEYISLAVQMLVREITTLLESSGLDSWAEYTGYRLEQFARKAYEAFWEFKELGGFANILEGLSNIVNALKVPFIFLKNILKRLIPKSTIQNVVELTENFSYFTRRLLPTIEAHIGLLKISGKIGEILKWVFGIIRKGTGYVINFVFAIKDLIDGLLGFIGMPEIYKGTIWDKIFGNKVVKTISEVFPAAIKGIKDAVVALGSKIAEIWKGLKNTNIFKTLTSMIIDGIDTILRKIGEVFGAFGKENSIQKFFDGINTDKIVSNLTGALETLLGIFGSIKDFFSPFKKGAEDINTVTASVDNLTTAIGKASSPSTNVITGKESIFDKLKNGLGIFGKAAEVISGFAGTIGHGMSEIIKNIDPGMIITEAFGVSIVLMVTKIAGAMKSLSELTDSIKNFFDGLNKGFKFESPKLTPLTTVLVTLGAIVGSIVALAAMIHFDAGAVNSAVDLILIFGASIIALTFALNKTKGISKDVSASIKGILSISKAIFLLSISVAILSKSFEGNELNTIGAVATVIAMVGILLKAVEMLSSINPGKALVGVGSLVIFIIALQGLVLDIALLSLITKFVGWHNVLTAAGAIALVIVAFGVLSNKIAGVKINAKAVVKTGLEIVSVALALLMVASAIKILSTIDFTDENVLDGVLLMLTSLIGLALVSVLLGSFKDQISAGSKAMLAIAASLILMSETFKIIEKVKINDDIVVTLITMGIVLAAMTAVFKGLSTNMSAGDIGKFTLMLTSIVGAIAVLSLIMVILSHTINNENIGAAAAALTVITAVILVLGYVFMNLAKSKNSWATITAFAGSMAVLIGTFVAALMLLTLTDTTKLMEASAALSIIMIACGLLFMGLSTLKLDGKTLKSVTILAVVMAILIGVIAGSLYALSQLDMMALLVSAIALVAVITSLVIALDLMSDMKSVDPTVIGGLLALSVAMIALGVAISVMSVGLSLLANSVNTGKQFAAVLIAIIAPIIGVIVVLEILKNGSAALIPALGALAATFLSFAVVALSVAAVILSVGVAVFLVAKGFELFTNSVIKLTLAIPIMIQALTAGIVAFEQFLSTLESKALGMGVMASSIGAKFIMGFVTGIYNGIATAIPKILSAGKELVKALWAGITGKGFDDSKIKEALGISKAVSTVVDSASSDTTESLTKALTAPFEDKDQAKKSANGFMETLQSSFDTKKLEATIVPNIDSSSLDDLTADVGGNFDLDLSSLNTSLDATNLGIGDLGNTIQTSSDKSDGLTQQTNTKLDNLNNNIVNLQNKVQTIENKVGNLKLVADGNSIIAMVDRGLGKRASRSVNQKGYKPSFIKSYS